LEDVFARALGEVQPSIERRDLISGEEGVRSLGSTTQENETPEEDGRTPAATQSEARRSVSVGGGLSAKPRRLSRSPAKQTPERFDSVGADAGAGGDFQETINPFKRAGLRRSPLASQVVQVPEADSHAFQRRRLRRSPLASQEFPATEKASSEEGKQMEASMTPKGPLDARTIAREDPLHSRHHREAQELPPTPMQLGIPDPVTTTPPTGIHDISGSRARKNKDRGQKLKSSSLKPHLPRALEAIKEAEPEPPVESLPEKPPRRKSARFSILEDPYAAKKITRDALLNEFHQLQADIALANKETKRLRLHYESKRSAPSALSSTDELLSLLVRSTAPEKPPERNRTPNSVFKSIGSFLPFSSRRKRVSRSLPALEKPIPSHLPIAIDNPLPYFQAFSPLTYTSNITLLPSEAQASESSSNLPFQEAQPISQLHIITASHSSGLFTARLSMIVDSSLLSISSVSIERLPPSAENELGVFLREKSSKEGVLTKDIGLICWAMSRWVEVSVLRARFWCAIEHELGTAEARAESLPRKKKRKRQRGGIEDDDLLPLDGHEEASKKQKWTRRQLLPHMGRTAMELTNNKVELRIEWRIKFDWTGEVDSSITASVRLPKSCKSYIHLFSKLHADTYIKYRAAIG
jgi:hypothetical protein